MMGQSDGKTTDMSVLTEVSDLCTVIEYAKGLEYTDSTNILLMGCSQGGFVSALTAAKLRDEIRKLVLFYPAFCIANIWLHYAAQVIIVCGKRDLHNALCRPVYFIKQVYILKDTVRFRLDRRAESVFMYYFEAFSCQAQFFFTVHVRIRHCSGSDHAFFSLGSQSLLKQLRRIPFYLNIFKCMRELITFAPAVTVNTAVRTSTVYIHPIIAAASGQYSFCLNKMHAFCPLSGRSSFTNNTTYTLNINTNCYTKTTGFRGIKTAGRYPPAVYMCCFQQSDLIVTQQLPLYPPLAV